MSKVIQRKNIVLKADFKAGGPTFTTNMSLPFTPDTMTVKLITYCSSPDPAAKIAGVAILYSKEMAECIGSFYDGCAYRPDLTFPLKTFENNTLWTFSVRDDLTTTSTTFNGQLAVHLEFIQHEKRM